MQKGLTTPVESVLRNLADLCGQPVRVTFLETASPERLERTAGMLVQAGSSLLTVECLRPVPVAAPGTRLSVEVLTNGNLLWFYTTLHSIAGAALDRLLIHAPAGVETVQRRRYPRVDLQVPVHLVLERTGQPISMAFRDLSAGGGALISKIPVAAGERVLLVFDLGSGLCFQDLGAEVVRCTDGPEGRYVVALRFVCEKDQEQALAAWVNAKLANQ